MEFLFIIFYKKTDKVSIEMFYFIIKILLLEQLVLGGKKTVFINFAFFHDFTAFADISVFIKYLFLGLSKNYIHSFSAVLQQSFRFAVFPKQLITFNPMQYTKLKRKAEEVDLFSEEDMEQSGTQPISHEDYEKLIAYLEKKNPPAVLPIQIAYYAGLRIGEVCGLTWQDINLEEQYLTVKRSVRYNGAKHKTIIGPTKRKKVRTVDFGDTLTAILIPKSLLMQIL